ncbi:RNA recognition motif [Carpediemonas membranifera]|uniref:RNA recognition motif n=1 Tax=Carpediemonas membranifera TaxID=201153 RepID=A0A8J6E130_9EUKA|nr:RNA recognition motif [Carpediemonas membranifera]|eukprot:KAG9392933.1 RNA recognition motif [Carpediemonas membranifera]
MTDSGMPAAVPGYYVHKRRWNMKTWDVTPEGCEGMTKQDVLKANPQLLAQITSQQHSPQQAKLAKCIVISSLPVNISKEAIKTFMEKQMKTLGITRDTVARVSLQKHGHGTADIEFKDPNLATACLGLGSPELDGRPVRLARPREYTMGAASKEFFHNDHINSRVPNSMHKLLLMDIPVYYSLDDVRALLGEIGPLEEAELILAPTGASRGMAFVKFANPEHGRQALKAMAPGKMTIPVGSSTITPTLRRAVDTDEGRADSCETGMMPFPGTHKTVLAPGELFTAVVGKAEGRFDEEGRPNLGNPTCCVVVLNALSTRDLLSDGYRDIAMDVAEGLGEYGVVNKVAIPRPGGPEYTVPGMGRIYVQFQDVEGAKKAMEDLPRRRFMGRKLMCAYYDLVKMEAGDYSGGTMRIEG